MCPRESDIIGIIYKNVLSINTSFWILLLLGPKLISSTFNFQKCLEGVDNNLKIEIASGKLHFLYKTSKTFIRKTCSELKNVTCCQIW